MRPVTRFLAFVAVAGLAACGDQNPVAPPQPDLEAHYSRGGWGRDVTVMTRNMYVGADVDAVMTALVSPDLTDDMPALMTALQTLQITDFATRVKALADEIRRDRPDVIGLQEVYELTVVPSALGIPDMATIQLDFLASLRQALRARGMHYDVAGRNTSTDATLFGGAIHIVDHDVLLVNPRTVNLEGRPIAAVYQANIGEVVPGLTLLRGYVARRARIDGVKTLLVNTHLESGASDQIAGLRYLQATELAGFIGDAKHVILTGDFNGEAGTAMYGALAGASLLDTWAVLRPNDAGLSCCQAPDLLNAVSELHERIDLIWTRGFTTRSGELDGEIHLVSADPSARVENAFGQLIWPSDHAGVVAELSLPRAWGHH